MECAFKTLAWQFFLCTGNTYALVEMVLCTFRNNYLKHPQNLG